MYLERDDHVTELIRLRSLGVRVLTWLELVVRPSTERLLERFQELTPTIMRAGRRRRYRLTPLSRVRQRILALLDFPIEIYTRLCADSRKSP